MNVQYHKKQIDNYLRKGWVDTAIEYYYLSCITGEYDLAPNSAKECSDYLIKKIKEAFENVRELEEKVDYWMREATIWEESYYDLDV